MWLLTGMQKILCLQMEHIVNAYLMDNAGNIIVSNPVNILLETMVEDSTYTELILH